MAPPAVASLAPFAPAGRYDPCADRQVMDERMHVVEVLLPVFSGDGLPFPRSMYDEVRRELTERFGGVTAFVRSPAEGLWQEEGGAIVRDDIVLFEVMTKTLDTVWWAMYRETLRTSFAQEALVVRASAARLL